MHLTNSLLCANVTGNHPLAHQIQRTGNLGLFFSATIASKLVILPVLKGMKKYLRQSFSWQNKSPTEKAETMKLLSSQCVASLSLLWQLSMGNICRWSWKTSYSNLKEARFALIIL